MRASKNDRQIKLKASMPNEWNGMFNANGNGSVERSESSFDDGFLLHYIKYIFKLIPYMFRTPTHTPSPSQNAFVAGANKKREKKNDFIQCDLFNVVDG